MGLYRLGWFPQPLLASSPLFLSSQLPLPPGAQPSPLDLCSSLFWGRQGHWAFKERGQTKWSSLCAGHCSKPMTYTH